MNQRELFVFIAAGFLSTPYKWGGDTPMGLDCSGLIVEAAQAMKLLGEKEDRNAAGWYQHTKSLMGKPAQPGDLLFWKDATGKVIHVEVLLTYVDGVAYSIGAAGGGSKTHTVEDAKAANAFVKVHQPRAGWEARSLFP